MAGLVRAGPYTMAAMDSYLITVDGSEHEVSTATARRLVAGALCRLQEDLLPCPVLQDRVPARLEPATARGAARAK